MDQTLINILVGVSMAVGGVIMTALGWFARTLWDRLEEQAKDISDIRVKMAAEYVSNEELANAVDDIKTVIGDKFNDIKATIEYIRARVDNIPQRRQSDPVA